MSRPSNRRSGLWPTVVSLVVAGLLLGGRLGPESPTPPAAPAAGAAATTGTDHRRDADLTAAALATPQDRHAEDDTAGTTTSRRRPVKVDTTATASTTCHSCSASARTLHIVYLDRPPRAALDNVATAWTRCTGCRATALSAQVVLVHGDARALTAVNRALALNADCEHCRTASAAFQLVLANAPPGRLGPRARKQLREWLDGQERLLRSSVGVTGPLSRMRASSAPADALRRLGAIVRSEVRGTVVRRDARLRHQ